MVVDAVVTWVDGSDSAHIKKRNHYLGETRNEVLREAAMPTRFNSSGEINYCLRSLLQFAPWLRRIYIVTDGQTPPILKTFENTPYAKRFQVVDHRDIFKGFEQYLPTFNSLTIESMLWRIPGLSNQFIYLNDDCMLLAPLKEEDFFRAGKPVLRGQWKWQTTSLWRRILTPLLRRKGSTNHRSTQENSAALAGYKQRFIHLPHIPFPLLKQTFADFFEAYPELLQKNLQYALRHHEQFWSISLAYHLGAQSKSVIWDNRLKGLSLHATHHSARKISMRLKHAAHRKKTVFACLQSVDQGTPELQKQLFDWLEARIPMGPVDKPRDVGEMEDITHDNCITCDRG